MYPLGQQPYIPGDDSEVTQTYRDTIASHEASREAFRRATNQPNPLPEFQNGDIIDITFSDGAKQRFVVTVTREGTRSTIKTTPEAGSYRNKPGTTAHSPEYFEYGCSATVYTTMYLTTILFYPSTGEIIDSWSSPIDWPVDSGCG